MGIGKLVGSLSPVGGAITGKGMFGKGLSKLADSGMGMLVPMSYLAKHQRDKNEEQAASRAANRGGSGPQPGQAMKKGGKVKKMAKGGSVSKRADGCATKGKTKGRFV